MYKPREISLYIFPTTCLSTVFSSIKFAADDMHHQYYAHSAIETPSSTYNIGQNFLNNPLNVVHHEGQSIIALMNE